MINEVSGEIITGLLDRLELKDKQYQASHQFLTKVVTGWKDGTLTSDRVLILENGEMRITQAEPPDGS